MKKTAVNILLFVIIPVFFSGLIYLLTRPDSIILFNWLEKIGLAEEVTKLRAQMNLKEILQNWIIYNSPALIWSFSSTVLLGIIWNYNLSKDNLLILLIPSILGILLELFQKIELISGTFDYIDIFLYFIGGLTGLLLIKSIKVKFKFNLL